MARTKKVEEEVQPQNEVKENVEPTQEQCTKEAAEIFNKEFIKVLRQVAEELLRQSEELEKSAAEAYAKAKWYNKRKRKIALQDAINTKMIAAGSLYYLDKEIAKNN